MKLALFAEIPVAKPWTKGKEQQIFKEAIEQAVFAEEMGFHSFWSTEHHFLAEMSHSTAPDALYGAIAARTSKLRLGFGCRLMPKPYNHPVRTAEAVATLDLVSNGRVELGGGRSATRLELEGFGINPHQTREMLEEAFRAIVGCWTNEEYEFQGKHWSMPRRSVVPHPVQEPHPPLWCASSSLGGHYEIGKMGTGLLSFATAAPPETLKEKFEAYNRGLADCTDPVGKVINRRKAALTIGHVAETDDQARREGEPSMLKYLQHSFPLYAAMEDYARSFQQDLGTYNYVADIKKSIEATGGVPEFDMDAIFASGGSMIGNPEHCLDVALRFDDAGTDLLFCLLNPWEIPHDQMMHSLELIGKHIIPVLDQRERERAGNAQSAIAA